MSNSPPADANPVSTSRLRRGAALGGLAAKQTLRRVSIKAGSVVITESRREQLLDRTNQRLARDFVAVLATMRGAAMKLGQLLSVIDLGLVDESARDYFRAELSKLQGSIDAMPFTAVRPVVEAELGAPLETLFASFEPRAFAAASIGQVHRAVTADGREVAVKVQYPGVRTAVRADLKNLALFLRMWKSVVPTVAAAEFIEEITTELGHELDYDRELVSQAEVADRYADHPFIHVPQPVPELSSSAVLTTEYVDGLTAAEIATLPSEQRDRIGEIIYRFYIGGLFHDCAFNGDAHPGNILYRPDGRVSFVDFGLYKRMAPEAVDFERQVWRRCSVGDAQGLRDLMQSYGVYRPDSPVSAQDCMDYTLGALGWNFVDDYVAVRPIDVSAALLGVVNPAAESFKTMREEHMPPEHLFSRRLDFLLFGTLGQIGAGGNWYRIAAEWLDDAPPCSELGRLDAQWRAAQRGREPSGRAHTRGGD